MDRGQGAQASHGRSRPPDAHRTAEATKPSDARGTAEARRFRGRPGSLLSPLWRKALRTLHVISSVGLLGADSAILALVIAGWRGAGPVIIYPAAHRLGLALIIPLALLSLTTGLALGLLTPWRVLRHWWVLLKFLLTAAGTLLALFVLVPTLDDAATTALAGRALADPFALVKDSGGACGVLILTVVLSSYKPFGLLPWVPIRETGHLT
ncbi:hypothetical protein [Sphaerisporangium corydalis]|uniref:DUF2269 domain-containing protein n=1 Tax=Sphaerisporangium corydalis TaxID=1441875 RepID=A0ABV9EJ68_9ACTN|nr:hypothetical protein [Sphaerisporangium corydalis]